jgi:hypothetical protein
MIEIYQWIYCDDILIDFQFYWINFWYMFGWLYCFKWVDMVREKINNKVII